MRDSSLTRDTAVEACRSAFHGQTFVWGERDCVKLAAMCLSRLGYRPRLERGGTYSTAEGALRALRRAGFGTTEAWMDDVVGIRERIDPRDALPGDILGFGDDSVSLTALSVALGDGRVLGFTSDMLCHIVQPVFDIEDATYVAWRCDPLGG